MGITLEQIRRNARESGSFGKAGPDGYSISQSFTNGGRTFDLAFDVDREMVKILGTPPEGQLKGQDAIADTVKRTPALFQYLQCHLELDNPQLNRMMLFICDQMRP